MVISISKKITEHIIYINKIEIVKKIIKNL